MHRDTGLRILSERGWLSATPVEFRKALLSGSRWRSVDAGSVITLGGEEADDLIGLASGTVELTTVFGVADTPVMHLAHPVFWMGYGPLMNGQPRRVTAIAKSPVYLASIPKAGVMQSLVKRPEWWQHLCPLAIEYGDASITIASDLLIRSSDRRCAAVLLRLGGVRFSGGEEETRITVPVTQDELADAANLSRNTTGDILRKLVAIGLIETGYRGIVIRSPGKLRAFAEHGDARGR